MDCQVWMDECTDRIRHQTITLTCQMFLFYTFQHCGQDSGSYTKHFHFELKDQPAIQNCILLNVVRAKVEANTRKKDTLATSQRCWVQLPGLLCSLEISDPGIIFGFGRMHASFYLPRMPFLRNQCSVYYTDTLQCWIFSKCNFLQSFHLHHLRERPRHTMSRGFYTQPAIKGRLLEFSFL